MRSLPSEIRGMAKQAIAQGWTLTKRRKHWTLLSPDGRQLIPLPSSTDGRSDKNLKAQMRRYGVRLR